MKTNFVGYFTKSNNNIQKNINRMTFGLNPKNLKQLEKDTVQFNGKPQYLIKGRKVCLNGFQTEDEFKTALNELMNTSSYKWKNITGAKDYEQAILPYAGRGDISSEINSYLRIGDIGNTIYQDLTVDNIKKYIPTLDFGLKKLDEEYGSYKGVVYRCGKFSEQTPNYVSTSDKMEGAINFADPKKPCGEQFNIILTNHGHKIKKMQERLGYKFAQTESEILLDPGKSYTEIVQINDELADLKTKFCQEFKKTYPNVNIENLTIKFWKECK